MNLQLTSTQEENFRGNVAQGSESFLNLFFQNLEFKRFQSIRFLQNMGF